MGATPNRRCLPGCLSDAFLVARPTNHDKDERDGNAKAGGLTTTRNQAYSGCRPVRTDGTTSVQQRVARFKRPTTQHLPSHRSEQRLDLDIL